MRDSATDTLSLVVRDITGSRRVKAAGVARGATIAEAIRDLLVRMGLRRDDTEELPTHYRLRLEEAPSPTASTSRAVAEWLETLFGGTPDVLARGTRLEGLGARTEVANDRGPESADLPSPRDVLGALVAMAEGARKKALVPFAGVPLEMALLRRGASVLVSL